MARIYPTMTKHVYKILFEREFQGCRLIWEGGFEDIDPSQTLLLSPRCQCATRRQRPKEVWTGDVTDLPLDVPVLVGHREFVQISDKAESVVKNVAVPSWVAFAPRDQHRIQIAEARAWNASFSSGSK